MQILSYLPLPLKTSKKRDEDSLKNEDILKEKRTLLLPSILLSRPKHSTLFQHPIAGQLPSPSPQSPYFQHFTKKRKHSERGEKKRISKPTAALYLLLRPQHNTPFQHTTTGQLLPHRSLCAATPHPLPIFPLP